MRLTVVPDVTEIGGKIPNYRFAMLFMTCFGEYLKQT